MAKTIFVNRYFSPDHSATSQLLSDLAFDLAARGQDIHVITGGQLYTAADFATLMRVICQRNGGTFVALPLLRDERRAKNE